MARDRDDLAKGLLPDDSGGWLTGFLADEDEFDRRSLWRLGSWGVGSVGAMIVAILASQSSTGLRREQVAAADLTRQSQQVQLIAKENQTEARRLASAIDTLNGDRDRLYSRVTVLEQGLDSVTGSISRQNAALKTPPNPVPGSALGSPQAVATPLVSQSSALIPAPKTPDAATTTAALTDKPRSAPTSQRDAPTSPVIAPVASMNPADLAPPAETAAAQSSIAKSSTAESSIVKSDTTKSSDPVVSAATLAAPLIAAKTTTPSSDPAATKPGESEVSAAPPSTTPEPQIIASNLAALEPNVAATPAASPDIAVQHTEFGVDLGSANSIDGLRALWRGVLKSNTKQVASLRPIIVVKERTNRSGMQLRLVAGPLTDAAAAATICAILAENNRTCETSVFDGQRLAVKDDKPSVSTRKPSSRSSHRRNRTRAVRVEEPAPPPKPEPSTLRSFFSSR